MKKIILVLILVLGVLTGGYYWNSRTKLEKEKTPTISTTKVNQGYIALIVSTNGRVVANFDVEIKCKASGQVIKLPNDISDKVNKNDLLVELDPIDEQRSVEQARVTLLSSQAKLAQAKENLRITQQQLLIEKLRADSALKSCLAKYQEAQAKADRLKELIKGSLTSQEDYDTAITNAIQAKSDLESAQIRIKELEVEHLNINVKRQDVQLAQAQVDSQ